LIGIELMRFGRVNLRNGLLGINDPGPPGEFMNVNQLKTVELEGDAMFNGLAGLSPDDEEDF
jgi:hypothetical protein